jgi:hypothetical protein
MWRTGTSLARQHNLGCPASPSPPGHPTRCADVVLQAPAVHVGACRVSIWRWCAAAAGPPPCHRHMDPRLNSSKALQEAHRSSKGARATFVDLAPATEEYAPQWCCCSRRAHHALWRALQRDGCSYLDPIVAPLRCLLRGPVRHTNGGRFAAMKTLCSILSSPPILSRRFKTVPSLRLAAAGTSVRGPLGRCAPSPLRAAGAWW